MSERKGSLGHRVLRGIEADLLGQVAAFLVPFFVTPMLVRRLGVDGFALYALIWTALNYMTIVTSGTNMATTHFTADYLGRGESGRLGSLLRRVLVFQIAAAMFGAALCFGLRGVVTANLLDMSSGLQPAAARLFAWVALAVPGYFLWRFALNIMYGQQRFRLHSVLLALQSTSGAVAAGVLVLLGRGLTAIACAFFVMQTLLAIVSLWAVRDVIFAPGGGKKKDLREYAGFSLKGALGQVMWVVTFQGDRVFIGTLLPLAQIGYYSVASGIASKFNTLAGAVGWIVFPMLSELQGTGQEERLRRLYLKATQLSLFLILPISILVFVLAPQFLTLWLGAPFSDQGTWPLRLLVLANLAYVAIHMPNYLASSKGSPHWSGIQQSIKTVLLIVLWVLWIPRWGILGAAAGLAVAEWTATPLFIGFVHRRLLGLGWWQFWKEACWRPAITGLALALCGLAVHGSIDSWFLLFLHAGVGSAVYLALGYLLLEPDSKKLLWEFISRKFKRG